MMDHIVVDVEIAHTIEETPGGWDGTDKMGVAVACVWEYARRRMRVYGPEDINALRNRILRADRVTGYNVWNFDIPVIWGVSRADWLRPYQLTDPESVKSKLQSRCNDLLRRIWVALGFDPDGGFRVGMGGAKLDEIAGATIGARKIGNGADAPLWYQAGLIQKVTNYCADDVAITRDLSEFVDRYGYVIHRDRQLFLKGVAQTQQ